MFTSRAEVLGLGKYQRIQFFAFLNGFQIFYGPQTLF